ncbi:MAG: FAD-binding protein, partial [Clostridia bacterium]
ALKKSNLHFFFDTYLVDIITKDEKAFGALVHMGGEYKLLRSNNIIVAAGGCGQVYQFTTSPVGSVGDGIAACMRAGALINDMELVQFHPTTLISTGKSDRLFLISEAVRGEGGILRNSKGEAFMKGKHELADLAPRDIVTREILKDLEKTGDTNVFLDVSSMSTEFFSKRFPTIYSECVARGINLTSEPIPVRPAQHYLMGGVKTDINGQTNIKGLYCCGECAETGIHGANRLASNSLLECLVFGRRSAEHINDNFSPLKTEIAEYVFNSELHTENYDISLYQAAETRIKEIMSEYVGAVRYVSKLEEAKKLLAEYSDIFDKAILQLPYEFKIFNMLTNAILIVDGALSRKQSIGAHYIINDIE